MVRKQNTLAAKTDAIENVRSAETPEAKEDDHGLKAWKKRKRGGKVDGPKPRMRLDRKGREGIGRKTEEIHDTLHGRKGYAGGGKVKGKGKTTVNVIIGPQGGGATPVPVPRPVPVPVPAGGPPMPPPGPRPLPVMPVTNAPPPGLAGPGMMPPAGVPGSGPAMARARGGRTFPKMEAGTIGGEGRLEKVDKYGGNAGPVIGGKNKAPAGGKWPRQKLPSGMVK